MTPQRRAVLGALAAAASVLAACGSNTSPALPTPSPAATLPPGSDTYPAQDTPLDRAPPAMAATWRADGVDLIPGHDTVDPSSKWPRTLDLSGGALSQAQADAVGAAVMRTQVLASWGDEHVQPALEAHMMNAPFLLGTVGVALAEGTSVHNPDCSTYPVALAVHAPSPATRDALVKAGQNVGAGAIPVVMVFTGPCTLSGTTKDGREVTVDTLPASVIVAMVTVEDDPVLGSIAHLDAATTCQDPAVAAVCAATG